MKIEELIKALNDLRLKFDADGVKVYLLGDNSYTIKVIKDGKIVHRISQGNKKAVSGWDIKR